MVYVVGGTDEKGQAVSHNLRYDPRYDRWERRAPLPAALHHVGIATLDGIVYALGGLTANVHLGPQRTTFAYDPDADRWTELAPFATPRGSLAVVATDGKIHILGGRNSQTTTERSHEVFDATTRTWSEAEPLPGPPRDHMGVGVLGGKIHVFGGRVNDYSNMLDRHDVFDPQTNSWSSLAALPRPRSAGAFALIEDLIVYAGGECKPGGKPFTANAFDDVDAYDAKTDRWFALTPMPEARHAFGAVTVGDTAYFFAGALVCGGGASNDALALTLD